MSYPLIQVPSAFQQLAATVQAIQEQRRQRQMDALRSLLAQTQLQESQVGIANTQSQMRMREAEMPGVIAGRESQTRARDAETRRAQRQDDALDALMRGLDPSMTPDSSQGARRVFEALPIPGVEMGTKRRPLKPGRAQPTTAQPTSGLPGQPAAATGERGNLGRALRAALALNDRVPANVANFIFEHLANNGAPEGIPAETMRLLFSGARAGAGVLSFGKVGRLVGVPEESLRAAGIDPNTVLPRTPPFFMTVGGQQSVEQTNLDRTIRRLESQVTRADTLLQTYLAEERVKLLTNYERLGNRGAQAIADPVRERRAQNVARQRLQTRIPSYDQMRTDLQAATRRLVSMSVGTTITGAQPEPEDELDAAIRGVIRP